MVVLLLLLLLTFSFPCTAKPTVPYLQHTLMDASSCISLRCEWRGEGEQCKSVTAFPTARYGYYFDFLKEEETDNELLTRLKLRHPLNTFTIVNNADRGEMCKRRRLWCNVAQQTVGDNAFKEFFEYLLSPGVPTELRAKVHC